MSGETVFSLSVGDLDNDGDPDIAAGGGDLHVLENDGTPFTGTWGSSTIASKIAYGISMADYDNNGFPDIAAVDYSNEEMYLFQNPREALDSGAYWPDTDVGTASEWASMAGDLDNDGDPDLVGEYGTHLYIWENTLLHRNMPFDSDGNGVNSADQPDILAVVSADLDNDGDMDLITGSGSTSYEIRVWKNNGFQFSGTWVVQNVGDTSGGVNGLAVADLNHDGYPDIISGDNLNNLIIWKNDGTPFTGTWDTHYTIGTATNDLMGIDTADFDNDGNPDIAGVSLTGTNEIRVWENPYSSLDTNPFDQQWSSGTGNAVGDTGSTYCVKAGDMDGDGWPDIVTGDVDNTVQVWENDGTPFSGAWTLQATETGDGDIRSVGLADFDNDGNLDIASGSTNEGSYELILWENGGSWSFTEHDAGQATYSIYGLTAADFNLDGFSDIGAVTYSTTGTREVLTFENDADSPFDWSFTKVQAGTETDERFRCVAAADFDNDGDPDLATGRNQGTGYELKVWKNMGGSAGYTVTNTAPATLHNSDTDDLLKIAVKHNGITGDHYLEISTWYFLLEEKERDPLTTTEAQSIIQNLYIYYDSDNEGDWTDESEPLKTITNSEISLKDGVQTIYFTDGDSSVQMSPGSSKTYFFVVEMTSKAESQGIKTLRVSFDPDANSLNENAVYDTSVCVEDSDSTTTGDINIPEISAAVMPVSGVIIMFWVARYRRKREILRALVTG